jgi:outer membrane protein insertion porin family
MDRDVSLRFDAEYRQTEFDYTDYDTQTYQIRPSVGFPLSDQADLSLRYTFEGDRIFNVAAGSSSLLVAEEAEGMRTRNGLGYTLSYDTRNSGVDTNAGLLLRFSQDLALHDDGATSVLTAAQVTAETKVFRDELTLRATLEGGALQTSGANSRLNDRFFLTSSRMRGFAPAGVGPRDLTATNQDALGGNYFGVARFETEFPIGLPEELGITGGLFYDIGSVWGLDDTLGGAIDDSMHLRQSAGVSIFWTLPIGPLRFNFSKVLDKESYDTEQAFDLTISTQF